MNTQNLAWTGQFTTKTLSNKNPMTSKVPAWRLFGLQDLCRSTCPQQPGQAFRRSTTENSTVGVKNNDAKQSPDALFHLLKGLKGDLGVQRSDGDPKEATSAG